MPKLIETPTLIQAAENKSKIIEEYVGNVNTQTPNISIAKMSAPSGWLEPGQKPEFQEITIVLKGELHVQHIDGIIIVKKGQSIMTEANEWVRYSTPSPEGAEYIAVCLPAFSPSSVHRDE
jgi:ethanolamine utilization protein EutQ (cupin superfamily)